MGDSVTLSLLLLCSLAGLVMVVGSLILLWKGRIILDREGNSVSEVELPLGIKFKTQFPVLVMFLFGIFMLAFPIHHSPNLCPNLSFHKKKPLEMVLLKGKVAADTDVQVFAIVDSQRANAGQNIDLSVPFLEDRRYRVRYTDKSGSLLTEEEFRLSPGKESHELTGVQVKVEISDRALAIVRQQTESSSVISEFKPQ